MVHLNTVRSISLVRLALPCLFVHIVTRSGGFSLPAPDKPNAKGDARLRRARIVPRTIRDGRRRCIYRLVRPKTLPT
jgi:hypothetical protein